MKIEQGVPVPEIKMGRPRKYDLDGMQVGESVNLKLTYQAAHAIAVRVKKRLAGWDFRLKHDKATGKTRIWRIA